MIQGQASFIKHEEGVISLLSLLKKGAFQNPQPSAKKSISVQV